MKHHRGRPGFYGFDADGWTPEQYAHCMRQAYMELKARGVEHPHVDYEVALQWHREHKRGALLIPAATIREKAAA